MAGRIGGMRVKAPKPKRKLPTDMKQQDEEYDYSLLQKPTRTSIIGLAKTLKLFQTATDEVREYLSCECDVLYECRVCRSIFRSLSNFIMHKRTFCQEKFSNICHLHLPRYNYENDDDNDYLTIAQDSKNNEESDEKRTGKKTLDNIIEDLTKRNQFNMYRMESSSSSNEELCKKKWVDDDFKQNLLGCTLDLESINDSSNGVFQTLRTQETSESKPDEVKMEVMEIHSILEGQTAVLGADGKIIQDNQKYTNDMKCNECNLFFATRKTLQSHIKYKHENERMIYPCPECPSTFATIWSVHRHLYNAHKRTLAEVRKMRPQIKANAYRRNEAPINNRRQSEEEEENKSTMNEQQKIDEQNQEWMDNFEADNDMQMCGGCGRRFERKAALNSHSQTCQKRIAARNIINANRQKRIAAVAEDKVAEKRSAKVAKLEHQSDTDKKSNEPAPPPPQQQLQKKNPSKKRKISIQIRYDYNKELANSSENETAAQKEVDSSSDVKSSSNSSEVDNSISSTTASNESKHEDNETVGFQESEVVSIASSNSSFNSKAEKDPLQCDSDSEVEEILGPCSEDNILLQNIENKEDINVEKQLSSSSESCNSMNLMELMNAESEENEQTLDDRMAEYVNLKKLHCLKCDIKLTSISKLRSHMAVHFNWLRFRCDICTFKAYDKITVYDHIKTEHNIQDWEKIEAIILQLNDWESVEYATDFHCTLRCDEVMEIESQESKTVISAVKENKTVESHSRVVTPDSCIVIEPKSKIDKNRAHQTKNVKGVKISKIKKKIIEEIINNEPKVQSKDNISKNSSSFVKGRLFGDSLSALSSSSASFVPEPEVQSKDNISKNSSSFMKGRLFGDSISGLSSKSSAASVSTASASSNDKEDALKKMVYEVIFGHESTTNKTADGKDTKSMEVSSNVVPTRPVRNRVKPLNKDFIYDLTEFKEPARTVLPSSNIVNSNVIQFDHNISESLGDSYEKIDNVYDRKMFLNESKENNIKNGTSPSSSIEDDHDLYIVENEKLFAVK